ncbi:hypothetical protein Tco_1145305 [Tanacetum coccineum]
MTTEGTQRNQEREKSSHQKLKQKLRESKIGDHGISKVKEHNVVSGDVREALPRMAPEPFRGKSHLVTDKVQGQISLLDGAILSFGLAHYALSEFEVLAEEAEELLMNLLSAL